MRRAFTLIEILFVIAIIALLIALSLPILSHAREQGRDAVCKTNFHTFGEALTCFALDHQEHLPGVYTWYANGPDWQKDWLSGDQGPNSFSGHYPVWVAAPEQGTLYPYINTPRVYRCPSLPAGKLGDATYSNGKYDYTMIGLMGGGRTDQFPDTLYLSDGSYHGEQPRADIIGRVAPMPFFIEENPSMHLNNHAYAGSFASTDQLGIQHTGNCNFAAIDGSAHRFPNIFTAIQANHMIAYGQGEQARRGIIVGRDPYIFDEWNWWYTH